MSIYCCKFSVSSFSLYKRLLCCSDSFICLVKFSSKRSFPYLCISISFKAPYFSTIRSCCCYFMISEFFFSSLKRSSYFLFSSLSLSISPCNFNSSKSKFSDCFCFWFWISFISLSILFSCSLNSLRTFYLSYFSRLRSFSFLLIYSTKSSTMLYFSLLTESNSSYSLFIFY